MYAMKDLLVLSQYQAYCKVKQVINKFKNTVYKDGKYLVMNRGTKDKPLPMLCVHLDTINTSYPDLDKGMQKDYIDFNKDTQTFSLNILGKRFMRCLGGDDRAGLWLLFQILADKELSKKYSFGIFFDEEVGGIGSTAYARDYKDYEDGVKCFIGLDRRGNMQCATYGSDNDKLIETFTKLGFTKESGTFTDASNLADNVACVNLSVGYDREHRVEEIVNMDYARNTLKVLKILPELLTEDVYEVEFTSYKYRYGNDYDWSDYTTNKSHGMSPVFCDCCGEHKPLYEADNGYLLCSECTDFYIEGGLYD